MRFYIKLTAVALCFMLSFTALLYVGVAFAAWDVHPGHWSVDQRGLSAFTFVIALLFTGAMVVRAVQDV